MYWKRVHGQALERGQKEAMICYCYQIVAAMKKLLDEQDVPSNSHEKGILQGVAINIERHAENTWNKGPEPSTARDTLCNQLTTEINRAATQLNFKVNTHEIKFFNDSCPGVTESGYKRSSIVERGKYYIKGKGKGGKQFYQLLKTGVQFFVADYTGAANFLSAANLI